MRISARVVLSICFVILLACSHTTRLQAGPDGLTVVAPSGLKMRVAEEDSDPTLWLSVPNEASGEDAVLVLLPEHVTVRRRGTSERATPVPVAGGKAWCPSALGPNR